MIGYPIGFELTTGAITRGAMGNKRRRALDGPVFTHVVGDETNSLLHHNSEDWYAYAEGYKLAANASVERALKTVGEWDLLVYPACFLYRHYLELRLKQIIRRGGFVVDEPADVHPKHRLLPLWERAKRIMTKIWPDDDEHLAKIDGVIREFDGIDPFSYAFRYPVDTKGQEHLADLRALNLRNVALRVNEIAPTLDGAGLGIEEYRDAKASALMEALQYEHW
jgi:hypothetical protein